MEDVRQKDVSARSERSGDVAFRFVIQQLVDRAVLQRILLVIFFKIFFSDVLLQFARSFFVSILFQTAWRPEFQYFLRDSIFFC